MIEKKCITCYSDRKTQVYKHLFVYSNLCSKVIRKFHSWVVETCIKTLECFKKQTLTYISVGSKVFQIYKCV